MCIAVLLLGSHQNLPLLVLFNRDEFFDRPTKQIHWWEEHPNLLAGRDLLGGGTWLGVTRTGRFAFITNYREVGFDIIQDKLGRGELPLSFLKGSLPPLAYLKTIDPEAHNGFNLIVGDLAANEVAYMTNRGSGPKEPTLLRSGIHALSNNTLHDDSWPKAQRSVQLLQDTLQKHDLKKGDIDWQEIFSDVMGDRCQVEDQADLPQTGLSPALETRMSAIFLEPWEWEHENRLYGTRSQTGIAVWADGHVEVHERSIDPTGQTEGGEVQINFFMASLDGQQDEVLEGGASL
eukprot:jgi/Botrbrau1/14152/Bobra.182_3s0092.1